MNILIIANHYAVCSARYAADAFTRLGHAVRHVGQPMGRGIWGMQVPQEYVWTPEPLFLGGDNDWFPDLIICMDSDPSAMDESQHMQELYWQHHYMRKPLVVWGVDNHARDYRRPYFDHYFLAHKSVSVMEWERVSSIPMGISPTGDIGFARLQNADMTWLPCAYDPVAFPPSPIDWEQREYDVACLGFMYPKRWALVHALRAAGLKVLAGTGPVYDAYRDAYHNSRVALVSSFNGDLPIRLFEGAGMGCVPLCDPIEDLRQFDNSPAMVYTSIDDAVDKAKLIARFPVPPKLGKAGAESCVRWAAAHTFDARAQVIIDWLEARS